MIRYTGTLVYDVWYDICQVCYDEKNAIYVILNVIRATMWYDTWYVIYLVPYNVHITWHIMLDNVVCDMKRGLGAWSQLDLTVSCVRRRIVTSFIWQFLIWYRNRFVSLHVHATWSSLHIVWIRVIRDMIFMTYHIMSHDVILISLSCTDILPFFAW